MILTHTAKIEDSTHGTFGNEYGHIVSIRDYPISSFLKALNELGLDVDKDISEKVVSYEVGDKWKFATLPLSSKSLPKSTDSSYRIREGKKTELYLRDMSPDFSSEGLDGGRCSTYGGIICDLTIKGDFPHELTETDLKIANGLLEAMREVYVYGKFSPKKKEQVY